MDAQPTALDRYVVPGLPAFVLAAVSAGVTWIRGSAHRAAEDRIARALKEALDPVATKLEEVKTTLAAVDKTLAVEAEKRVALTARVDAIERTVE